MDDDLFAHVHQDLIFHEERVVALDPGQHYSLAGLMGGGSIPLSGLQKIYSTYHEVACRNFPKRPYA